MRSVLLSCALALAVAGAHESSPRPGEPSARTRIGWTDVRPLHPTLEARGLSSTTFPSYIEQVSSAHARRVREGDLDHLVFYLLQSTRFTTERRIEPALSAKALVDGLSETGRERFLRDPHSAAANVPAAVRSRVAALLRALDAPSDDPRLEYFRDLVRTSVPAAGERTDALHREYLRVMRFVYEKEFVAQRAERPAEAVAELYRARGLSTDTAVEAGYLVYLGLGVLHSLDPDHRIRRVLIVGPGLDLAPRTALDDLAPPESYQPWAVMDALLALGLARAEDLEIVAADINPRVVNHLRRSRAEPPVLTLVSEIRDTGTVTLSDEYRDYFARMGRSIADPQTAAAAVGTRNGHMHKTVAVGPAPARTLRGETLDIVTERLGGEPFDLVVATNILPYFDDVELMLALSNVAGMLAPGGAFLHNEARPLVQAATAVLGLPVEQSRHAVIATVRGAPPLADSVWLHRRRDHRRTGEQEILTEDKRDKEVLF